VGAVDEQAGNDGETGDVPPLSEGENRRITGGEPPDNDMIIARKGSGRFATGNAAGTATRYAKGKSGNPKGRPKGRFRSGTRAAAALLDAQGLTLAQKAIELALGGDAVAVRFCLGRILGVRRGQPVELGMKPVAAPADLSRAVAAITGAVAEGRVTPDEALSLSQMLDGLPRVFAAVPPPPPGVTPEEGRAARQRLIDGIDRLAREAERRQREAAEAAEAEARRLAEAFLRAEAAALPEAAAG